MAYFLRKITLTNSDSESSSSSSSKEDLDNSEYKDSESHDSSSVILVDSEVSSRLHNLSLEDSPVNEQNLVEIKSEPTNIDQNLPSTSGQNLSKSSSNSQIEQTSFVKIENNSDQSDSSIEIEDLSDMSALNIETALKIIPEYDGNPKNLDRFINNCQIIFTPLKNDQHETFVAICMSRLVGKAFSVIQRKNLKTWELLKAELKAQFSDSRTVEQLSIELINATQKRTESVQDFANRIEELYNTLIDVCTDTEEKKKNLVIYENIYSSQALKAFEEGLLIDSIKLFVKACRFSTLREAVTKAHEQEKILTDRKSLPSDRSKPSFPQNKCQICLKPGHIADKCFLRFSNPRNSSTSPSTSGRSSNVNVICSYCKVKGHHINQCFKKQNADRRKSSQDNPTDTTQAQSSKNLSTAEQSEVPVRASNLK